MHGVDQGCIGRVRRVVPLSRGRFASCILGRGDDFEVPVAQLVVECLPAWQIETAPSPGCPGDHEHFLAVKIGEAYEPAPSVRHREVWSDAGAQKTAAED